MQKKVQRMHAQSKLSVRSLKSAEMGNNISEIEKVSMMGGQSPMKPLSNVTIDISNSKYQLL